MAQPDAHAAPWTRARGTVTAAPLPTPVKIDESAPTEQGGIAYPGKVDPICRR